MKNRLLALTLVLLLVLTVATSVALRRQTNPNPHATDTSTPTVYWGALIKATTYGLTSDPPWDMTAVDRFETNAGKKISVLHFGLPWYASTSWPQGYYPFNPTIMNTLRSRGIIPFIDWSSRDANAPTLTNQPNFSLGTIINGQHDSYLKTWASAAKSWGHPFFLRLDWEMNGSWYPWDEGVNGNTTGQYVQAWKHVHDIFTAAGATNVTWVWCPNTEYPGSLSLSGLYPGDNYVDWTCFDGYNWGSGIPSHPDTWKSFYTVAKPTYDHLLTLAPSKPIIVGETASSELGGSKAAWITDALTTQLPTNFPNVKAYLWFDWATDGADWPIETSTTAQSAFASGISLPYFASPASVTGLVDMQAVKPLLVASGSVVPPPPAPAPSPAPGGILDSLAPSVTITSPVPSSSNGSANVGRKSNISLGASASDNVGVTRVEMYVNGSFVCTDSAGPYTCSFRTGPKSGVNYDLVVRAYDAAGNVGRAEEFFVTN